MGASDLVPKSGETLNLRLPKMRGELELHLADSPESPEERTSNRGKLIEWAALKRKLDPDKNKELGKDNSH
jgi:hypothetical protein